MKIGTIVQAKYFNGVASTLDSSKYQQLVTNNFQQAGMFAFGQMPFVAKGPNMETDYDWKNTDALVNFGQTNSIEILYNTVVNSHDGSFPEWYKALDANGKEKALENHVKGVVNRYKGKVAVYKLVNEARIIPKNNAWGTKLTRGKLIAKISHWAKEVYPEGVFLLNDHIPFLRVDELREQYKQLITEVIEEGGAFDAIGLEGHLGYRPIPFQLPSDEEIKITLDDIHQVAKLPVHITEFDLSYDNGPLKEYPGSKIDPNLPFTTNHGTYSNWFEYQGYAYKYFAKFCQNLGYVEDLVFWGFLDDPKVNWERPGTGFFNRDFVPKPSASSLKQ